MLCPTSNRRFVPIPDVRIHSFVRTSDRFVLWMQSYKNA